VKGLDHILHRFFVKPILSLYLKAERKASYDGFRLVVKRGVFHPLLFFSTQILYAFTKEIDLKGKNFLEIGSGSGLLSLLAFRKGARVTAVDVDPAAVENTKLNFSKNFGKKSMARVLKSDVFSQLPIEKFDVILINPPYYFKDVVYPSQQAWYCGKDGIYFEKLFSGLKNYVFTGSEVFMILEENCEVERIVLMARRHHVAMEKVTEKKKRWERSFIFRVSAEID
jgi:release factor glutamine methyltransferase